MVSNPDPVQPVVEPTKVVRVRKMWAVRVLKDSVAQTVVPKEAVESEGSCDSSAESDVDVSKGSSSAGLYCGGLVVSWWSRVRWVCLQGQCRASEFHSVDDFD